MRVGCCVNARLAQSVERLTLNQVVVGSSPTVGDLFISIGIKTIKFFLEDLV